MNLTVKLSNSLLDKIKSAIKNETGVFFKVIIKHDR